MKTHTCSMIIGFSISISFITASSKVIKKLNFSDESKSQNNVNISFQIFKPPLTLNNPLKERQ